MCSKVVFPHAVAACSVFVTRISPLLLCCISLSGRVPCCFAAVSLPSITSGYLAAVASEMEVEPRLGQWVCQIVPASELLSRHMECGYSGES